MQRIAYAKEACRILAVHTCRGLDHAEWVTIHTTEALPDGTVRHRGSCHGQPVTLTECPGGDLEPGWNNPCPCWNDDYRGEHPGHCCFRDTCCDHHDLMRACEEKLPIGDVPMHQWNASAW